MYHTSCTAPHVPHHTYRSTCASQAVLGKEVARWSDFRAQDEPSVGEPLVLGVLLSDMARVAWMVLKCGGNLNDAHVAMNDIPVYCNVRCR